MPNVIQKVPVLQNELDKAAVHSLTSGWMEANEKLVKYVGGNEVKIASLAMDGLGDYDRAEGFVKGSVNLTFKTYEMTQDRGRLFTFDENDVDETNFILTAARVMGEFQRTRVVPEIDAYRYSKIASLAIAGNRAKGGYTATAETILTQLLEDIAKVENEYGEGDIIITLNRDIATLLDTSKEISRHINSGEFQKGSLSLKVQKLNDTYPIIRVPSKIMKTAYTFKSGKPSQEAGGFEAAGGAKDINWIISHIAAPIAVTKTDKIRVFDPETYQKGRMWAADYRKVHDLWIPDKKLAGIYVNIKQTL